MVQKKTQYNKIPIKRSKPKGNVEKHKKNNTEIFLRFSTIITTIFVIITIVSIKNSHELRPNKKNT